MSTTTIYLTRHTNYENLKNILPGRLPVKLSASGIKQANRLKKYFTNKQIDKIYSSAVLRCQQTASIISDNKITIKYDKKLLETFSAYQGYWIEDWSHFFSHTNSLGGETNQDIQARMIDFYNKLNLNSNNNYIICSHGDPLFFLYQYLDKQPLLPQDQIEDIDGYQSRGSIRIIKIKNNKIISISKIIENKELDQTEF